MFDVVVRLTRTRLVPYLIAGSLTCPDPLESRPGLAQWGARRQDGGALRAKSCTGGSLHRDTRERSGVTASIAGQKQGV